MASNINTTNIDTTFPVAGQDNDSQGFRDNFFNTNENFGFAKAEIEALQGATTGNYVFDIAQVPDNTMDNWVLTYDDGTGLVGLEVIPAQASAAEGTEGIVFLATSGEVITGTDLLKAVTPATLQAKINAIPAVPGASETVSGIIELATQAEVDTGTDTIRAVTPLTLTNWSGGGGGTVNNWVTANNGADFVNPPTAAGADAIAIGFGASAPAATAIAIGYGVSSTGDDAIGLGNSADASGISSPIAIGNSTVASADYTVSIGGYANATSKGAIAVGYNSYVYGGEFETGGIAIGSYTTAGISGGLHAGGIAIGFNTSTNASYQTNIGLNIVGDGVVNSTTIGSNYIGYESLFSSSDYGKFSLIGDQAMFVAPTYLVTALPPIVAGGMIYVSNATGGGGLTGSQCFSNGTDWIDVTTGLAVV